MMARKGKHYNTRKRCAKCGHIAWYRPHDVRCKVRRFGPQSYCCWGLLESAPITRRRTTQTPPTTAAPAVVASLDDTQRGDAHRRRAEKKLDAVRRRMGTTIESLARLRRLLAKQQRDERKWAKEAALTDEQIGARRARAQHAARVGAKVQRVRRRLTASAALFADADASKVRLVRRRSTSSGARRRAHASRRPTRRRARP